MWDKIKAFSRVCPITVMTVGTLSVVNLMAILIFFFGIYAVPVSWGLILLVGIITSIRETYRYVYGGKNG